MEQKKITLHWTRHAESCANLETGHTTDNNEYPTRKIGYSKINAQELNLYKQSTYFNDFFKNFNLMSQCGYHPNLSYIGMQQAILWGESIKLEEYDIICVSPMLRTIMTALMGGRGKECQIYVVPFIIENTNPLCSGQDAQNNPLSSDTLQKHVFLVKDWLEQNWFENFDDIKLMNDLQKLNDILKNIQITNTTCDVTHKIKIIENILTCRLKKNCTILNDIISLTETYITCEFDHNVEQANIIITQIKMMNNVKYIRGPKINFSVLKHFESMENAYTQSFDNFLTLVIPYIIKQNNLRKNNLKVLCVSHGNSMTNYFNNKYDVNNDHPYNTETFEEIISCSNNFKNIYSRIFNGTIYKPIKIRTNYENFEELNENICSINGLKGVINYGLENTMDKKLSNDMLFYKSNPNKYIKYGKTTYLKYKKRN